MVEGLSQKEIDEALGKASDDNEAASDEESKAEDATEETQSPIGTSESIDQAKDNEPLPEIESKDEEPDQNEFFGIGDDEEFEDGEENNDHADMTQKDEENSIETDTEGNDQRADAPPEPRNDEEPEARKEDEDRVPESITDKDKPSEAESKDDHQDDGEFVELDDDDLDEDLNGEDSAGELVEKEKTKATQRNKVKTSTGSNSSRYGAIAFFLVVAVAFVLYYHQSIFGLKKDVEPPIPQEAQMPEIQVQPEPELDETKPELPDVADFQRSTLEEAQLLRESLLLKRAEINQLKSHYQEGIYELEDKIRQEMADEGITSYEQAIKNKSIELNLRTIQRRRAYIQKLAKPARWVEEGIEELLYLRRRARFDIQIMGIASGIDVNQHMRHLNAAIQKYRLSAEKLAIDISDATFEPSEKIWNEIKALTRKIRTFADAKDQAIWREICAGDLSRIAELTVISPAVARCLSQTEGSDLFLSSLSKLSPDAAEQLFQWQGNWICLNGLKTLSPEIAAFLFQWEGSWISLNGLSEFPSDLAKLLPQWEGRKLELMGLKSQNEHSEQLALQYLAQWEMAGGTLYVPEAIRVQLDKMSSKKSKETG